jgi:hypothetical protein
MTFAAIVAVRCGTKSLQATPMAVVLEQRRRSRGASRVARAVRNYVNYFNGLNEGNRIESS